MVYLTVWQIVADVVLCLVLGIPLLIFKFLIQPTQRGLFCDDESIRYPRQESTITVPVLFSVGFTITILTVLLMEFYRTFYFEPTLLGLKLENRPITKSRTCHPYFVRIYYYLGYFLFGVFVCQILTDLGKFTVGRLRPHFIAVCIPDWNQMNCNENQYVMPICTGDAKRVREARLSFPSGHSSFSFYSMTFTVLYLEMQPIVSIKLLKGVVQLCCISFAILTSLSRIVDYYHHWSDVLAGSLLGITVAIVISVFFVGMFRYPKQRIFINGFVAPDVETARLLLFLNECNSSKEQKKKKSTKNDNPDQTVEVV